MAVYCQFLKKSPALAGDRRLATYQDWSCNLELAGVASGPSSHHISKEQMKIERPIAENRKINSRDDFEWCYMRHQYLRRVTYNPSEADMAPYTKIISRQARKTYNTYEGLFRLVGFDVEDLVSIARIHLVSFLGLYKLDKTPNKYIEFATTYWNKNIKEPNEQDVENKDRANLTMFMKQRMEDVVRVCRQKARNIKGLPMEDFYVFYGPKRPPKNPRMLLEDHEKYQFRKLDLASFKSIKKKLNIKNNEKPFKFAGYWYIAIPLEKRNLSSLDLSGAGLDPRDNIHNKNPEELLFGRLKEEEFEDNKAKFKSQTNERKGNIVRYFIRKNKNNPIFKEEVELAKKFIKDLRD